VTPAEREAQIPLLGAARAEIAQLRADREANIVELRELRAAVAWLTEANSMQAKAHFDYRDLMESKIARLTAPPGASAVERARDVWQRLANNEAPTRPEEESLFARAIEQAERGARAAALEEAACECDSDASDSFLVAGVRGAAAILARRIRALAEPEEKSE
jgi:hypothetical protein